MLNASELTDKSGFANSNGGSINSGNKSHSNLKTIGKAVLRSFGTAVATIILGVVSSLVYAKWVDVNQTDPLKFSNAIGKIVLHGLQANHDETVNTLRGMIDNIKGVDSDAIKQILQEDRQFMMQDISKILSEYRKDINGNTKMISYETQQHIEDAVKEAVFAYHQQIENKIKEALLAEHQQNMNLENLEKIRTFLLKHKGATIQIINEFLPKYKEEVKNIFNGISSESEVQIK